MSNKGKRRIRTPQGNRYVYLAGQRERVIFVAFIMWVAIVLRIAQVTIETISTRAYANDESIVTLEGAVSHPSEANAGQTVIAEAAPSSSWDEFVQAVEKVAPMYNFPKNVVLAQGALESARGNSTFAQERNNYLGIGAFDSNPDQAYTFENAEQCVIEYMRIIRKNFPEAWANRDNPEQLLYHLKHNKAGKMYATDPNYIVKVQGMKEWSE